MITRKSHEARSIVGRLLPFIFAICCIVAVPVGRAQAGSLVPFHAKLIQTSTFIQCPTGTPAAAVCVSVTGKGTATHIGHMSKESVVILTLFDPSCGTFTENAIFTAANGDTITAVQAGTGCFTSPTTVIATATYTVTGGTGRFSGANGSGTASATNNAVGPGVFVGPATYDGDISSSRSLAGKRASTATSSKKPAKAGGAR